MSKSYHQEKIYCTYVKQEGRRISSHKPPNVLGLMDSKTGLWDVTKKKKKIEIQKKIRVGP